MKRKTFYLQIVHKVPGLHIQYSDADHQYAPCNYLQNQACQTTLYKIEYTPGSDQVTEEKLIEIHLRNFKRQHGQVIMWEKLELAASGELRAKPTR